MSATRSTVDIVIDDLERIKEETWSAFDMGCLAGAIDLIRELADALVMVSAIEEMRSS